MKSVDVFKVAVVDENDILQDRYNLNLVEYGVVTNFVTTRQFEEYVKRTFKPLDMNTMFSVEERENASFEELVTKQFYHYVITYGLGLGDVIDITAKGGQKLTLTFIKGVTKETLQDMIVERLYDNAPIKNVEAYADMVREYKVKYNLNKVKNNELRVRLYNNKETFKDGDDAVRYIVLTCTGKTDLIKSKAVIETVASNRALIDVSFLEKHITVLSNVFNRHKKIIMALKDKRTRSAINAISRLSKWQHKPVKEPESKRFVSLYQEALKGNGREPNLDKLTIRDKFKLLNFIAKKRAKLKVEFYNVRNGKVWVDPNPKSYDMDVLEKLQKHLLLSVFYDLEHLKDKRILLDENVDYGLPISNKQTVGQLPFWTKVSLNEKGKVSAGIHWRNDWGARDLDLSAIDLQGNRTGWGQASGYNRNSVVFSGDVTNAHNGAMEFMTSKNQDYMLVNNIFSGEIGCECELVFGSKGENQWIEDVFIRERFAMKSRNMVIGFVKDNKMIVYNGLRGNDRVSNGRDPVIEATKADMWTIEKVLDNLSINYDVKRQKDVDYDYDLSYKGFTFDKLQDMMVSAKSVP